MSNQQNFNFELRSQAVIRVSGEKGEVVERAEYTNAEPSYLLRYRDKDGSDRAMVVGKCVEAFRSLIKH